MYTRFQPPIRAVQYHILRTLGRGGFADVFECVVVSGVAGQPVDARKYAMKMLRDRLDPEIRQRFRRELELQLLNNHPNLIPVLDYNLDWDPPFFVMPVMRETLRQHLDAFRRCGQVIRALPAIRDYLLPVCAAVSHLHSRGVVHRDIKPDNIFIDLNGVLKLGDFGICHAPRAADMLRTWCGLGTANYTAPETLARGEATPQSDVYSLGVVLYELVTGRVPGLDWWKDPSSRPSRQHPRSCHPNVDVVLAVMTNPRPADRYPSVAHAAADLRVLTTGWLPGLPAYVRAA